MSEKTKIEEREGGVWKTEPELSFEPHYDLTSRKILKNYGKLQEKDFLLARIGNV